MGDPVKVILVGPKKSGKSAVANLLASTELPESVQLADTTYMETAGTRILEFDMNLSKTSREKVQIELWDCSGDIKYESCWPAILSDAKAVVLMYNPENATQTGEIEQWYRWFVSKPGIKHSHCLVMANDCRNGHDDPDQPPPRSMREANFVRVDADSQSEMVRAFQELVEDILN